MYSAVKKEEEPKVASQMPKPKGYKLLISPVQIDEKTEGGVYMPDALRDAEGIASIIGFVVKMGDDAYKDKEEFRLINDDTVEAVVDDPRGYRRI